MPRKVFPLIHQDSPYAGFAAEDFPLDTQGWGSIHPAFEQAIAALRPSLIIEVGTWKGGSALHMASIARRLGLESEIVCVDTFLGSHEHWIVPEWKQSLNLKNGYPRLYFQFLANVVKQGMQDLITPFPISGTSAAYFFLHHGIVADLVYIDAGHEYPDVLRDIELYWSLLRPGGALIGDDFTPTWPGVVKAVKDFAAHHGLTLQSSSEKWVLVKPKAPAQAA